MAEPSIRPTFGDNVTIRSTPETEAARLAGKIGSLSGFTTPSVTGVQVLGARDEDYALAVMFDDDALPTRGLLKNSSSSTTMRWARKSESET